MPLKNGKASSRLSPSVTPKPTKPGTKTSATGASADSFGGDIGFRCGAENARGCTEERQVGTRHRTCQLVSPVGNTSMNPAPPSRCTSVFNTVSKETGTSLKQLLV